MDSEKELIKLAQAGDGQAFTVLYRHYLKMVYGYVFRKVGSREDTDDLTSEIWMSALKGLPTYAFTSSFKNWLFGIVKHKILDYWRGKYKIGKMPLLESICLEENENEQNDIIKNKRLTALLAKLPVKYRSVLKLRFLRGYNTYEIARELGLTVANVKVIQFRALKKASES